jgi:Zn ribbon nucleic-acid-binding protein
MEVSKMATIEAKKLEEVKDRFEKNMREIQEGIRTVEAIMKQIESEQAPAWKPEDLIGKLVRGWFDADPNMHFDGIYVGPSHGGHYEMMNNNWRFLPVDHIRPLTEAEALALVWRKPGALICPNCHKEAFYASSNEHGANHVVCSECGAPWNPQVTEKTKTRYDWSKAPDNARYGVTHGGFSYWYTGNEPSLDSTFGWKGDMSGKFINIPVDCILDTSGDWRDSLERRPE